MVKRVILLLFSLCILTFGREVIVGEQYQREKRHFSGLELDKDYVPGEVIVKFTPWVMILPEGKIGVRLQKT